jgi:hypothetical protein
MTQFVAYVSLTQTQYQWSFQEPIDWRYQSHIFLVYFSGLNFREYPHNIWPKIWYSTSNLGSWNSHWKRSQWSQSLRKETNEM